MKRLLLALTILCLYSVPVYAGDPPWSSVNSGWESTQGCTVDKTTYALTVKSGATCIMSFGLTPVIVLIIGVTLGGFAIYIVINSMKE